MFVRIVRWNGPYMIRNSSSEVNGALRTDKPLLRALIRCDAPLGQPKSQSRYWMNPGSRIMVAGRAPWVVLCHFGSQSSLLGGASVKWHHTTVPVHRSRRKTGCGVLPTTNSHRLEKAIAAAIIRAPIRIAAGVDIGELCTEPPSLAKSHRTPSNDYRRRA